nr:MAG TPA: hypothetical protein [Caudoviricetes sp.]
MRFIALPWKSTSQYALTVRSRFTQICPNQIFVANERPIPVSFFV